MVIQGGRISGADLSGEWALGARGSAPRPLNGRHASAWRRRSHHFPPPTPSISTTWRVSQFVGYLKTDMTRCCLETRHLKRGERCWGAAGHAGQELYIRAECQGRGFFPWSSRRTLSSLNLSNNRAYFSLFQCLWRKHWRAVARWVQGSALKILAGQRGIEADR